MSRASVVECGQMLQEVAPTQRRKDVTTTTSEDRLLLLPEIAEMTRMPEGTLRYLHHRRELPFLWKRRRRLVAYEADVKSWLKDQREATSRSH